MIRRKITCVGIVLAVLMQMFSIAYAEEGESVSLIASDTQTEWKMSWSWERSESGFLGHSEILTENGLSIINNREKFKKIKAVAYPSKDNGVTKCEAKGEYKFYYRTDASGEPIEYDEADTESQNICWYHQGRGNYMSKFSVNESVNDGRPIVVSYDYYIETGRFDQWNAPKLIIGDAGPGDSTGWFQIYKSSSGTVSLSYNNGTARAVQKLTEASSSDNVHNVRLVISPKAAENGRIELKAVSLDGNVVALNNAYSFASGKTDDDIKLDKLVATMGFDGVFENDDVMKYTNLTVERGIENIEIQTPFEDGTEITDEGISIISNIPMQADALSEGVAIYDEDYNGEPVKNAGIRIEYNDDNTEARIYVSGLEPAGNYRMEISGAADYCGINRSNDLTISFKTAKKEQDTPDDKPKDDPSSSESGAGEVTVDSNDLKHGRAFSSATLTDGVYEMRSDIAAWWAAEQIRYMKNNNYYYKDSDGNEIKLGYGNENWNYADFNIAASETVNTGEPIVLSYEYNAENVSANYEWGSPYLNALGFYAYFSKASDEEGMVKYYKDGGTIAQKLKRGNGNDGWHSVKLVILPNTTEGRYQLYAVVFDEYIYLLENAYSTTATGSDEKCFIDNLIVRQTAATETRAKSGDSVLSMRNIKIERVDGIRTEVFAPNGTLLPDDDIKLNFNYSLPQEFKPDDFTICEVLEDGSEKSIENSVAVKKAYDDKQIIITVGDGGLCYNKNYRLYINKNIVVNDYIGLTKKSYDIKMREYTDEINMTAELSEGGVKYSISGGGDSFFIMAASYDKDNRLIGINSETVLKEGSGERKKARGNLAVENKANAESIKFYIFDSADNLNIYRLPVEFKLN